MRVGTCRHCVGAHATGALWGCTTHVGSLLLLAALSLLLYKLHTTFGVSCALRPLAALKHEQKRENKRHPWSVQHRGGTKMQKYDGPCLARDRIHTSADYQMSASRQVTASHETKMAIEWLGRTCTNQFLPLLSSDLPVAEPSAAGGTASTSPSASTSSNSRG